MKDRESGLDSICQDRTYSQRLVGTANVRDGRAASFLVSHTTISFWSRNPRHCSYYL